MGGCLDARATSHSKTLSRPHSTTPVPSTITTTSPSSGSVATRGIEQNRQRAVLSQLPAGGPPEGLDVLLNSEYSRLHLGMFFQVESLAPL